MMPRVLGRRAHDPVAVAAAPRLHYASELPPPPVLDRSAINYQPNMYGNNSCPDCTVAGLLNAALAVEAISTNGALAIDPNCWIPFYANLAGCAPTVAAIEKTDGLVMLDVLRQQGNAGFDIGAVAPLSGDFGVVGLDRVSLARVMNVLGFAYVGIELNQADVDAPPNQAWQPWANPGADVGGHCLCLWSYSGLGDTDTVTMATWGELIQCTWARWDQIAREAYAILFPTTVPAGIDAVAMAAANSKWLAG